MARSRKPKTPSFEVPADVTSASPSGWVFRSDAEAAPKRRSRAKPPRARPCGRAVPRAAVAATPSRRRRCDEPVWRRPSAVRLGAVCLRVLDGPVPVPEPRSPAESRDGVNTMNQHESRCDEDRLPIHGGIGRSRAHSDRRRRRRRPGGDPCRAHQAALRALQGRLLGAHRAQHPDCRGRQRRPGHRRIVRGTQDSCACCRRAPRSSGGV